MNSVDSKELQQLKAKREYWLNWFMGDNKDSIWHQVLNMIWDAAVFRIINEARRLAEKAEEGGVEINGMTQRLIDKCFFENQFISIRRLVDPKKGAWSLSNLITDIKKNRTIMTRRNLLSVEGLEYYYSRTELDGFRSEERHTIIDRLTHKDETCRKEDDVILRRVFTELKEKLNEACKDIKGYVDRFVAHAISQSKRANISPDDSIMCITLGRLEHAHKTICQVANFVGLCFLWNGLGTPLAHPQYNTFKYIDRPLVKAEQIPQLQDVWRAYDEETSSWTQNLWEVIDATKALDRDNGET